MLRGISEGTADQHRRRQYCIRC